MEFLLFNRPVLREIKMAALSTLFVLLAGCMSSNSFAQFEKISFDIAPIEAPFYMPQLQRPVFPDNTFNIRDFGARMMNEARGFQNTDAIHKAIEAAHNAGGGKVVIPAGDWYTGPIHLLSNVNLHVSEGATLYFSENRDDYLPVVPQRHNGVECYNYSPPIYAYKVKNVAITGTGTLDAQGEKLWWDWSLEQRQVLGSPRERRAAASPLPLSRRKNFCKGSEPGEGGERPSFAIFWKSEDILIEGVSFINGPMWNVHPIYSQRIIIRGITINSLDAHNGDGIVLDSSKDILVEYVRLMTGDDAIVLKSGLNEDGLKINIPTENVVIRNYEAIDVRTGSGGIVFGSETSGGIRNVYVHNAYFNGSDRGIRFKSRRGRGNVVENIYIRDIRLENITHEAIHLDKYYGGVGETGLAPLFKDVFISNIEINGAQTGIEIMGLPEKYFENISFENITITNVRDGARFTRVNNIRLKNVEIHSESHAMIILDAYEMHIRNMTLSDRTGQRPLIIEGGYSGAIFTNDFPREQIELGPGVSKKILLD